MGGPFCHRLDATLLAPIVEAASSSRRPLYENATGFLGKLTKEYPLARDSVEKMAADARSHVRFNAILCLQEATPVEFTLRLIRQVLRDKRQTFEQRLRIGPVACAFVTLCRTWRPRLRPRRAQG